MKTAPRYVRLLIATVLAAGSLSAEAAITTYSSRATFESLGSISYNYGFEDGVGVGSAPVTINTSVDGFSGLPLTWTVAGVTYQNNDFYTVVGPVSGLVSGNVLSSQVPGSISGAIGGNYNLFAFDFGTLLETAPVTISVTTNGSSWSNTYSASAASFLGFKADAGEHFTLFSISASPATYLALDNVTLGNSSVASPIPEPSMLAMLLPGLLVLGFAARRRSPARG